MPQKWPQSSGLWSHGSGIRGTGISYHYGPEERKHRSVPLLLGICALLAVALAIVILAITINISGRADVTTDYAEGSNPEGNNEVTGSRTVTNVRSKRPRTRPRWRTTQTTRPTPTTPARPSTTISHRWGATAPPLLCSVNGRAESDSSYPPDGLCDILMYAHVRKSKPAEGDAFIGDTLTGNNLEVFRRACNRLDGYGRTSCGLSFDAIHFDNQVMYDWPTRSALARMRGRTKVEHLGVLNLYAAINAQLSQATQNVLYAIPKFRHVLGGDRNTNKIILGIGHHLYNNSDSWNDLYRAASTQPAVDVDILVILTSVQTVPSMEECFSMPASALQSSSQYPVTLEKAVRIAEASFNLPSSVTVAFSFQMGVLSYTMATNYTNAINAIFRKCQKFIVSEYSQACQLTPDNSLVLEKTPLGYRNRKKPVIIHTYETLENMTYKANFVLNTPTRRQNVTWFLFNVHETDHTRTCLPDGPFSRLRRFREFYRDKMLT